MKRLLLVIALSVSTLSMLSACGNNEPFQTPVAPIQSQAVVAFSVVSTSTLPVGISGLMVRANLPAGATVATDPANAKLISSAALAYGSAVTAHANNQIYGSYSAGATGKLVRITVLTPNQEYRNGEFAKLTITPSTLSLADFTAINSTPLAAVVGGFDPVAGSTVDLSGMTAVTISAVTAL